MKKQIALIVQDACTTIRPELLFGPAKKAARQQILTLIRGKRPPLSDCGYYATMDALYVLFNIQGWTCQAHKDNLLMAAMVKEVYPNAN